MSKEDKENGKDHADSNQSDEEVGNAEVSLGGTTTPHSNLTGDATPTKPPSVPAETQTETAGDGAGTSPNSSSSSCCLILFWIFSIWTRIVALTFCVFAFLGFWDIQHLVVGDDVIGSFEIDGNTLKIPLVMCLPSALVINGTVYSTGQSANAQSDVADVLAIEENCRSLDYMVYAVAISLLLSGIAVLVFLVVDCCSRCRGHRTRTRSLRDGGDSSSSYKRNASPTIIGIGMLVLFMLVQTGVSTGALVEQLQEWVSQVQDILDVAPSSNEDGRNPAADINDVESLANMWILLTAASLSFVAAFWIVVDAAIIYPCRPSTTATNGVPVQRSQV